MIEDPVNIFLVLLLLMAVITDIRFQKIPNVLTYPSMAGAAGYHALSNGTAGLLFSLEGIGLGMAMLIFFYLTGGMGAGDVKLMGAVGGILGPEKVFIAFLFTGFAGGLYAVIVLIMRGYYKTAMKRYWFILKSFLLTKKFIYIPSSQEEKGLSLNYGIAIAIGTLVSLFFGNLL